MVFNEMISALRKYKHIYSRENIVVLLFVVAMAVVIVKVNLFNNQPEKILAFESSLNDASLSYEMVGVSGSVVEGEQRIEKAKVKFANNQYLEGLNHLRAGVTIAPRNLEGRLLLADFYLHALEYPEPQIAIKVLEDGVPFAHYDINYLQRFIQLCFNHLAEERVLKVAQTILSTNDDNGVVKMLALAAANSCLRLGRYNQAENFLLDYNLLRDINGVVIQAQLNWNRGLKQEAIDVLKSTKNSNDYVLGLISHYYREIGDLKNARHYVVLRTINQPLDAAPRIDLLYVFNELGEYDKISKDIEIIIEQYPENEKAMLSLANFGADNGRIELTYRVYDIALKNGFKIAPFALLKIEAYITARKFEDALKCAKIVKEDISELLEGYWGIYDSLLAVAYCGLENEPLMNKHLNAFLNSKGIRSESYAAIADRFDELECYESTELTLEKARELNPQNQNLLLKLIISKFKNGSDENLNEHIKFLLEMDGLSFDVLESLQVAIEKYGGSYSRESDQFSQQIEFLLSVR